MKKRIYAACTLVLALALLSVGYKWGEDWFIFAGIAMGVMAVWDIVELVKEIKQDSQGS